MKKLIAIFTVLPVLLALLLAGCSVDEPDSSKSLTAPSGDRYFNKYVSIGNSLTAGYMDSGLVINGQLNSYPVILAGQLGLDTTIHKDSEFSQPYIDWPGVGTTTVGEGMVASPLYFNPNTGGLDYDVSSAALVPSRLILRTQPTPYHNLGVPGARLGEVLHAYSGASSYGAPFGKPNSFFDFINRASFFGNEEEEATILGPTGAPVNVTYQTASMGRQAIAKGASLATVWIGANDVLGGATGGNPVVGDNPLAGENVTSPATFAAQYGEMMQILAGGMVSSSGFPPLILVADLPEITSIPYFIPEALFLMGLPEALGGVWPAGYEEGEATLLTLPVQSWLATANPFTDAIPSNYTLTAAEVATVHEVVTQYNMAINGIAAQITTSGYAKVVVVGMNARMQEIASGTSEFGPLAAMHFLVALQQLGGNVEAAAAATLFSLDGVHPNNKGYAVVANEWIAALNSEDNGLGVTVDPVDPANYVWDPTYQQFAGSSMAKGIKPMSPEVAEGLNAIFR
jgi:lysophospholipase L1-like esterase